MSRRFVALSLSLAGAWAVAAGCAASGSNGEVNGPVFDIAEAGADAPTEDASVPADVAKVPSHDGSTLTDSALSPDVSATTDAPGSDATPPVDAADGGDGGTVTDAGGCTGTTAILGGNASSLFGATAIGTAAFTTHSFSGSLTTAPALVAFGGGGGFNGLLTETGNALSSVAFTAGTWSAPSPLGGVLAIAAPSVAAVGTSLQAVYLDPQHFYFHAAFASAAWDTGADPVRPPNDAGVQAFGPARAAAAGTATQLVIAYEGNDRLPYAQTWTSGTGWDNGVALGTAVLPANTPMAIVALASGTSDLLAVYVDGEGSASANNTHLFFVLRNASSKAWSSPAPVNTNAYTNGAPTLTAMSGDRALLAWQGQSGGLYESVLTAGTTSWSTPAQITATNATSAPSLAAGVCGDDAVAAYVSAGAVYTTHFAGGSWTAPTSLTGGAGATAVAIATAP